MPLVEQDTDMAAADAVSASYQAQRRAMLAADADALGALLTDEFSLTHMTGYRQSAAQWLADVRSGAMSYHAMQDVAVSVDTAGPSPVLTARTRTEATIWGAYGTWPLQLRIQYTRQGQMWLAVAAVASVWS